MSADGDDAAEALNYAARLATNLTKVWARSAPEQRGAPVGSVWPGGFAYQNGTFRTPSAENLIDLLGSVLAENRDARAFEKGGRPMRLPGQDQVRTRLVLGIWRRRHEIGFEV